MTHARSVRDRPTPLAEQALMILDGKKDAPSGSEIKDAQLLAVQLQDHYALALWSRIRWQWLVARGRNEICLE